MVSGPDGKGSDCKPEARKYRVRFSDSPPRLVTPHGAGMGLISPLRWFESIWHHQKKVVKTENNSCHLKSQQLY